MATHRNKCIQCGKNIRVNSRTAAYLGFLIQPPKGGEPYEAWTCKPKCLKAYNEED